MFAMLPKIADFVFEKATRVGHFLYTGALLPKIVDFLKENASRVGLFCMGTMLPKIIIFLKKKLKTHRA